MTIHRVVELLRHARSALFVTGAGISVDSGLPTYRGVGGLYKGGPTDDGIPIEEVLSGPMFEVRPQLTWRYLHGLEQACRGATHNRAHQVIAELQGRLERVRVLTQNVDGLHRAAGSRDVIDIHGDLHRLRCTACPCLQTVPDYAGLAPLPECPQCGAVLRPDVVLFGETLPVDKLATLAAELRRGFDVLFAVGTTALFPYISGPFYEARERGIPTVEINPEATLLSDLVDVRLALGAAEALDDVWRNLADAR